MKTDFVSVVITCYNYGKYLQGCIESVLSQTYQDFEIIVVNDGSTDNTDEVMRGFLSIEKIHYIKQKNGGQANAKNIGIRNSKGEYIAFLDADDLWARTKLEKEIPLFSDSQVGVVYSRSRYINEEGKEISFELSGKYLRPRKGRVTEYLIIDNFVPFSSSVVRRQCFAKFGGFDESLKMSIDWDLWLRISTNYDFDYVDEPLLLYRLGHPGQMSRNAEERQRCSDRIMDNFIQKYPETISNNVLTKAKAYTYCSRAWRLSGFDLKKSSTLYMKAIKERPGYVGAYRGLLKNALIGLKLIKPAWTRES